MREEEEEEEEAASEGERTQQLLSVKVKEWRDWEEDSAAM